MKSEKEGLKFANKIGFPIYTENWSKTFGGINIAWRR